ncbi:hypothetical protein HBH64_207300 [Parastagonospora nodorum]|nr:hypothetical protein HBH53_199840 [Parastagonospora nodorum]KAH3960496.1 hypothetical protein HBH51_191510 [Parastagonospora nodorum]KAH4016385.1 hypothetical protein HBI09_202500 [Parastagonospora nodorum]KAH4195531.1 hypothetical protein HBI95_194460 [Parastagonospora nodorum]KAH4288644.1 hypothetical protein HBI02_208870 [Parastagonospora nodorum]
MARVFAYALQTSVRFRRAFPAASCGVTTPDASQTSRLKGDGGEIRAVYRHPLSCPRENACSSMKEVVEVDRWNFLHCVRLELLGSPLIPDDALQGTVFGRPLCGILFADHDAW